ncbi:MAG TPA: hypothetical protein VK541_19785 [Pedobacter sp.]|uniref:hypothetical protein n=1 Tax=Pedobacter sp. TaxID=1411316 RepID=UPI002BE004B2|nr:hypothetical protein [Pedobacter sp.]HMI04738.1 hypothetical protein [Pedobacter sp.]
MMLNKNQNTFNGGKGKAGVRSGGIEEIEIKKTCRQAGELVDKARHKTPCIT